MCFAKFCLKTNFLWPFHSIQLLVWQKELCAFIKSKSKIKRLHPKLMIYRMWFNLKPSNIMAQKFYLKMLIKKPHTYEIAKFDTFLFVNKLDFSKAFSCLKVKPSLIPYGWPSIWIIKQKIKFYLIYVRFTDQII